MTAILGRFARSLSAVAILVTAAITPVSVSAESLSDAMVAAYKNSGLLQQQRALLRVNDENVAVAVSAMRPVLSFSASVTGSVTDPTLISNRSPVNTSLSGSVGLSASLLLFDFGATKQNVAIAKENVLMAREALIGAEQTVLLNAVNAYLNVVAANESVALQANSVRLITQELRAARDRFEVGEITQTDVSLAEARLAAARSSQASAQGNLLVAREAYKAAIGHYPGPVGALPKPPSIPTTVEAAKAQARTRHPDILSAQRSVTIAEMSIELARRNMLPNLSATASASETSSRTDIWSPRSTTFADRATGSVGVTLSGQIYSGGRLSALYRQAMAQAEASRAALLLTMQSIDQTVGNAWAQLAIATASIEASDRQIKASRVALRGAQEEATLGSRTTLDVLNAEQELLNAQASHIQARADQYAARYALLSAMGLLTAEHLRLGVVTYDEEAYFNAVKNAPVRQVSPQGEKLDSILETLGRQN